MVSILSALSFAVGVDLSLAVDDDLSIIMQSANLCDHPQMGIAPSRQQARDHWVMSAPLMHERMTLYVSESRADGRETHHDISHRCSCTERGGHKWEPSGEIPSILVFLFVQDVGYLFHGGSEILLRVARRNMVAQGSTDCFHMKCRLLSLHSNFF